jgi:hypothetical protein
MESSYCGGDSLHSLLIAALYYQNKTINKVGWWDDHTCRLYASLSTLKLLTFYSTAAAAHSQSE